MPIQAVVANSYTRSGSAGREILLACTLATSWITSAPAAAQSQDPPETIIVTASRIPQPLHAIGSSVSIIDLDDFRGTGVTIAEVLRHVPGISISQSGGIGSLTSLRMRGGEANHTAILLDGAELGHPDSGEVDFAHLTTAGIERIEILHGAQSALWGSRAISGVINLISRQGGDTVVILKSGSDREHVATVRTSSRFDRGSLNASLENYRTGGDNVAHEGEEEDGYQNTTMQWGLRWAPDPETVLRLSMRQVRAISDYDQYRWPTGAVDAPYKSKNRRTLLNASWLAHTGRIEHQWDFHYLQTKDHNLDDFMIPEAQGQRIQARGLAWRTFEHCLLERPCTLGGGLEWVKERYTRGDVGPLDFKRASALAVLKWQPEVNVFLDLSLRREENSDFGDYGIWRASLAYRFPNRLARTYLASGLGIANPTLTERFGYFPDNFKGNPELKPERARTVEAGVEYDPGGACCRVGLRAFTQSLSDEVQWFDEDGYAGPILPTSINQAERSRRRGVELELEMEPHPHWTVSGSYAYLDATEPGFEGARPEVRRPRHQYRFALSSQFAQWQAHLDAMTVRGLLDSAGALENYWLLNLSVRRALTARVESVIEIQNLLDESYEEIKGYRAPDRQLRAGLQLRFD